MPADLPCAASTLVSSILEQPVVTLREVVRTTVSLHYETGIAAVPVLCVATPAAVRLPHSVVVHDLPRDPPHLVARRWWTPDRPAGLVAPAADRWAPWAGPGYDALDAHALVGHGPGLTPAGDDLLAGALVAAHATGDPRLDTWRRATRAALATRRTTAVSVGMLHSALDGWASPELAGALGALCGTGDPGPAVERLLAVGSSSGRHLLDGVLHVLSTTSDARGAAA